MDSDSGSAGLPPLEVPPASDVPTVTDNVTSGPDVDPGLLRLLPLLGTWRGRGKGGYEGEADYDFGQQMVFTHDGRAILTYESVTWRVEGDGSPSQVLAHECGVWRPRPGDDPDAIEAVIVHDDGLAEVSVGRASGVRFELVSDVLARTESGPDIGSLHRLFGLVEGDLMYAWDKAVDGTELSPFMSARLRRV